MSPNPVRLRDVAQAAGTSTKTASRVINGFDGVAPETRRRVQEAVEALGYQVDLMARSLRKGVDDTLGIVVPTIGDPFFAQAIEEVEQMVLPLGINLLVASNSRDPLLERKVVDGLLARRVAGLIVAPYSADYGFLTTVSTPVVFLDRHPEGIETGVVLVEDQETSRQVVNHLASFGHRRIALLVDDLSIKTSSLRQAGYYQAMSELGLEVDPDLVVTGCVEAVHAEQRTHEMLDLADPPTAIFSSRSAISLGVVRALHMRSRTDIAFVSFGDFGTADVLMPAITVVDHDPRKLAHAAVDRLRARMDGLPDDHADVIVPLHLIPRGSGEIPFSSAHRKAVTGIAQSQEAVSA
jgi:LacI family transcriptional regulator